MSERAFPLSWPRGRPRTPAHLRKRAAFNVKRWNGSWDETKSVSIADAWRARMQSAHPDKGGSAAQAARLNWARDEGRKANG